MSWAMRRRAWRRLVRVMTLSHSAQGLTTWTLSCGAAVVVAQEHERGGDDIADPPRVEADVAERPDDRRQQRVASLGDGP